MWVPYSFIEALLFICQAERLYTFYLCFLAKISIPCLLPTFSIGLIFFYWLVRALIHCGYCCFWFICMFHTFSLDLSFVFKLYKWSFRYTQSSYLFVYMRLLNVLWSILLFCLNYCTYNWHKLSICLV